jgi:hypothetical protein
VEVVDEEGVEVERHHGDGPLHDLPGARHLALQRDFGVLVRLHVGHRDRELVEVAAVELIEIDAEELAPTVVGQVAASSQLVGMMFSQPSKPGTSGSRPRSSLGGSSVALPVDDGPEVVEGGTLVVEVTSPVPDEP